MMPSLSTASRANGPILSVTWSYGTKIQRRSAREELAFDSSCLKIDVILSSLSRQIKKFRNIKRQICQIELASIGAS
jgi:hypothetical protein